MSTSNPALIAGLVAMVAGALNSVAGGGMLLTFPILAGFVPPVVANATCTLAQFSGSFSGAWGYRSDLRQVEKWVLAFTPSSVLGAVVGALLLTRLEPSVFGSLAPWLILLAALLFLAQPFLQKHLNLAVSHEAALSRS